MPNSLQADARRDGAGNLLVVGAKAAAKAKPFPALFRLAKSAGSVEDGREHSFPGSAPPSAAILRRGAFGRPSLYPVSIIASHPAPESVRSAMLRGLSTVTQGLSRRPASPTSRGSSRQICIVKASAIAAAQRRSIETLLLSY